VASSSSQVFFFQSVSFSHPSSSFAFSPIPHLLSAALSLCYSPPASSLSSPFEEVFQFFFPASLPGPFSPVSGLAISSVVLFFWIPNLFMDVLLFSDFSSFFPRVSLARNSFFFLNESLPSLLRDCKSFLPFFEDLLVCRSSQVFLVTLRTF